MNDEPVAWMFQGAFDISTYVSVDKPNPDIYLNPTPLYTHPVKELTDEEIYACFHQYFVLGEPKPTHYELEYEDLIEFARAILRKASEK
jgi:hypothetical protein